MSKKEQTQQNIIDAFWSLYETTRIEKITVKNVCAKANINRSTFYEYFKDVFEVLEAIENSLIPQADTLPTFNPLITQNNLDIETHLAYFNTNKKYLKVLLSENGNPAFRFKVINTIRPIILTSMEGKEKPENFEYILEYTLWGMIGVLSYHMNSVISTDEKSIIEAIKGLSEKLLS